MSDNAELQEILDRAYSGNERFSISGPEPVVGYERKKIKLASGQEILVILHVTVGITGEAHEIVIATFLASQKDFANEMFDKLKKEDENLNKFRKAIPKKSKGFL